MFAPRPGQLPKCQSALPSIVSENKVAGGMSKDMFTWATKEVRAMMNRGVHLDKHATHGPKQKKVKANVEKEERL